MLDDEGKNLLLRKIAGNYESELKVLKGNLKKAGYISEVKSVISEFTQYGVDFAVLDSLLETLDENSYLYYKLQDIRKVYEGFETYLADKYITKEELLDVLSGIAGRSEPVSYTHLDVYKRQVGDTCYSWSEDIRVYNPNGKEIVAKDNAVSILRRENVQKAYFQCHTDITIPYEELEEISVVTKTGKTIILLKDGRFVLKGTEILNEPFDKEI